MLTNKIIKVFIISVTSILSTVITYHTSIAANLPLTIFPLDNYKQDVDVWFPPNSPHYNKPLLSTQFQQQRMRELYQHLFSTADDAMSPWSANFINLILLQNPGLTELVNFYIEQFSNQNKASSDLNYGENFRVYASNWIDKIANNISRSYPTKFAEEQRAIMVKNASLRALPTDEVSFYSYQLAGEGYPFDNLQITQLWVGTPIYVFNYSKDQRWALITSSSAIGWVETDKLGNVDSNFIARWQKAAQHNLIATIQTETPVLSVKDRAYQFSAYVGAIFPLEKMINDYYQVLIPIREMTGKAKIQSGLIALQAAVKMPLSATPANFTKLFNNLKNRPYGWGGLYHYNDCSAEMESLFRPFGIWLPRNSSQQTYMGKTQDKTTETPTQRIAYLSAKGHPLMTIVYIGGHVFLYIGNYSQPKVNNSAAVIEVMTYQDIWGLRPADNSTRAVIGQSLFFPLLLSYPEDPTLVSLAAKSYFIVSNLDEMPETSIDMPALLFSNLTTSAMAEDQNIPFKLNGAAQKTAKLQRE